MALYPKAIRKLIPPGPNDPRIKARVVILHVDANDANSLYDWFNGPSGGVESHFFVKKDGTVEQYRDTAYQADANWHANDFALSIETQGYAAGEWTDAQLAAIKALILWCHTTHGIPLVKCPTWDGAGIGYHILFMDEWAGGPRSCPGPDRVKQFNNIIVPWLSTGAPAKDWFDMATQADLEIVVRKIFADPDVLRDIARFVLTGLPVGPVGNQLVLAGHLSRIEALAAADLTVEQVQAAAQAGAQVALDAKIASATVQLNVTE